MTKMQEHSTKIMTAQEELSDLSKLDGLSINFGKTQPPMEWFCHQFNQTHSLDSNEEQTVPLLSADKLSFVPDILEQIQTLIRNHMSGALIDHHANQQIDWNQMVDLQQMVDAMSATHLNHLKRWTSLRNPDQFNAFAKCPMKSPTTPTMCISSSSTCPMTTSSDLNLLCLDNLTME